MTEIELNNLKQFKMEEQKTLKKLFTQHQVDLTLEYNRWDCLIKDKGYLIELKNRDFTYDEFIKRPGKYNGKPLIEIEKYKTCLQKATQLGYKFIYIFYFTCGTALYINLSDETLPPVLFQESNIKCPQTSFNEYKSMVYKAVYIIPSHLLTNNNSYIKYTLSK